MAARISELPEERGLAPRAARTQGRFQYWVYAALVLLFAVLGVVAARYYASEKQSLTDGVLARRALVARLAAATVSERLERVVELSRSLASRVRFSELVADGQWQPAARIMASVPDEFAFVERLFVADRDGTVMADVPALDTRGGNFSRREWFQGVTRSRAPYVSGIYRRAATPQRVVFAVAAPIRGANGAPAGILVLQIDLDAFFDWAGHVDVGRGGSLMVVDRNGATAHDSARPASREAVSPSGHAAVARLLAGQSGVESDGEEVYAYTPARHGWGVVVRQPAADAFAPRNAQLLLLQLAYLLGALFLLSMGGLALLELRGARNALGRHRERLRMLNEIDRAVLAEERPEAIAAAVVQPLRELLGVPRAIVNRFDPEQGWVEWVAAAGRRRTHVGPGVRFAPRLMGDIEALRRGETQVVDVKALPQDEHTAALLASGVEVYMVVPMIAGGELLGMLSFGGRGGDFPQEQVNIVREVAAQLAIAMWQARLLERVKGQAAELEARVRSRTAELEAANRELESFSYSVSHDLRAPLRAVDGYARMLDEDYRGRLDDEGRRLVSVVRDSAARMGQLIDDLLAFARLGRQELAPHEVDMKALAAEAAAEALGDSRAAIDIGILPRAHADRSMMKQVWANLVGNAIKYSSRREGARVEIGAREDGSETVYWVRDNGAGFDMRYAHKLFGVFQRLHRAEEFPGTGVGLAIVQRVIARHGGRVWAEGRPGEGACFHFSLPRKNP